ncbi:hypothetical protein [Phyllobacterium sp. OV277]|uniref:hypothetical protein n=1 Tax=Phyllobacterium sp. OV277 TaxID=1882772 RepID=UPI00111351D6|nr:hypothetical protein [Phyllobacterium sp. OV277]
MSDKGLAKICQRNLIPVPGKGYWAKLEAGQSATKTPLREMYTPELETVHIGDFKRDVNPYVAFAIAATQSAQQKLADETPPPKKAQPNNNEPASRQAAPLNKLHPSVKAYAAEFQKVTPDREGTVQLRWIKIHRDSVGRVIAFLSTLAFAFEPFGISFSGAGSRVKFINDNADVDFEITSPKKRVVADRESWKSYENVYVGRLAFRIFGNAEGIRKNWVDEDDKKIEDCVDAIVKSYRINLTVQKEHDDRKREEARIRQHMAHRRGLAEQRKKREELRLEFLTSVARTRHEVHELKQTIGAIPDTDAGAPDYSRMIKWAMERLSALEKQTAVERLQESLVEKDLFPEPDNLADPEGEPPPKQNYWDN